jgi:hypothetical protein
VSAACALCRREIVSPGWARDSWCGGCQRYICFGCHNGQVVPRGPHSFDVHAPGTIVPVQVPPPRPVYAPEPDQPPTMMDEILGSILESYERGYSPPGPEAKRRQLLAVIAYLVRNGSIEQAREARDTLLALKRTQPSATNASQETTKRSTP